MTLDAAPYTLDRDQALAVLDDHRNTLVTARAGSGKTRVIVAKVAYLISHCHYRPEEIIVFMFNRAAAEEVNERLFRIKVDQKALLPEGTTGLASTFHKFALDLAKLSGQNPDILSELDHAHLIQHCMRQTLAINHQKVPPSEQGELLRLVASFIARAGQRYFGPGGLSELQNEVEMTISRFLGDPDKKKDIRIHQRALATYLLYIETLTPPRTDFNILMSSAADLLTDTAEHLARDPEFASPVLSRTRTLRYILVDEYQDFSYLFLRLIQALRGVCPGSHLFAVGDDWQAINRFAGSDVDYFINFSQFFPEDTSHIPLLTNYRSDRAIVENANQFMHRYYDPDAALAVAHSHHRGSVHRLNPAKLKFDPRDILEDGLADGRFMKLAGSALQKQNVAPSREGLIFVGQLLKQVIAIIKRHRRESIMILHRHNFLSVTGMTLPAFSGILRTFLEQESIMRGADFDRQVRIMTMHKSKGLEADTVILLELNRDLVFCEHPHGTIFPLFGDTRATERADEQRLLYVALTRARHTLYILSTDKNPPC